MSQTLPPFMTHHPFSSLNEARRSTFFLILLSYIVTYVRVLTIPT